MKILELLPSPFDRLDPIAHALRWWVNQMTDIIGSPRRVPVSVSDIVETSIRLPRHILAQLPEQDGFLARVSLPKGQADTHRRALSLRVADLAPVSLDELCIVARSTDRNEDGTTLYTIAMARRSRLDAIESEARQRGAQSVQFAVEGDSDTLLTSPRTSRRRGRAHVINTAIALALIASMVAAATAWSLRFQQEAESLADDERSFRTAALSAQAVREQGRIAAELTDKGILKRRSTAALEAIAELNEITPKQAWWTHIVWTPEEVTISAESNDAIATVAGMSTATKAWSIELSGTVSASPNGAAQAFELLARPRKGGAK